MQVERGLRKRIAVIGAGISGMSAAWLLGQTHDVTVYEEAGRLGGHSNTVTVETSSGEMAVDIGFIVYNQKTYPNLTALFEHLGVPTQPSQMSFAVSLADGRLEYSGGSLARNSFAQRSNVFRPRFWSMLNDLWRFYREAPRDLPLLDDMASLEEYLDQRSYGVAFRDDHLLPMAAAIWSASTELMLRVSRIVIHPLSRQSRLAQDSQPTTMANRDGRESRLRRRLDARSRRQIPPRLPRRCNQVPWFRDRVQDRHGKTAIYDDVVIATHADQALELLQDATGRARDSSERSAIAEIAPCCIAILV